MHVEIGIIVKKQTTVGQPDFGKSSLELTHEFIKWLVEAHDYDYGGILAGPTSLQAGAIKTAERLHLITRYKFFEGVKSVRRGLELWSDEDIWDGKKLEIERRGNDMELVLFKLHAANFLAYGGPEVHLYDREWSGTSGITNDEEYRRASELWDKDYYISTADMHF